MKVAQENIEPTSTLNNNIARQLIWRRNCPYFYQTIYTQQLQWPSLSVEWWFSQDQKESMNSNDQTTLCFVTFGTHTSGQDKNHLIMAKVYIPNQNYLKKNTRQKKITETIRKNDERMQDKIIVIHSIEHQGEVNKIKHHPKKTNLIATRTPLGEIHVFDKTKFRGQKVKVKPSIILSGHETQGYSIEWNPNQQQYMVAGSYDGKLTLWDINKRVENIKLNPLLYFNYHEKQIEDVSHNIYHNCIFASCDDDGQTVLWDTRNSYEPIHHMKKDNSALYSVQFSPLNRHIFATGGSDRMIKIWDVRNLSQELTCCKQTGDHDISQLKWSTNDENILWSVSGDQVTMWDLYESKKKFVHAGHMDMVNQIDIHPCQPNVIVSVDSANDMQVFQPTPNAFL